MKWILACLSFGLFGFGLSGSAPKQTAKEVTVIISGGARGQLSPCGCTKPMSGGLKRLATVVRELKSRSNVVWIDSGDIIDAPGRQSQMKAETYSELMGVLGVDVVAYTSNDQRQGLGLLVAGTSLSKRKWLGVEPDRSMPIVAESIKSGITISVANEQVLKFEAEREAGIVILDGKRESISLLQKPHEMVVFASEGIPTVNGSAVSPGSHLRGVVIATFRDNRFVSAKVVSLDPSIKDDPKGKKIFGSYLTRITQERLIDSTVKDIDHDFAGSAVCGNCHGKLYKQFAKTGHAHAYDSLVKEGHQADPDCVSCHVVGLNSKKGFIYEKTKNLAQVGCESCHGAGREHARYPGVVIFKKVTEAKCLTCHTPSNSPTFNFKSYWEKIKH